MDDFISIILRRCRLSPPNQMAWMSLSTNPSPSSRLLLVSCEASKELRLVLVSCPALATDPALILPKLATRKLTLHPIQTLMTRPAAAFSANACYYKNCRNNMNKFHSHFMSHSLLFTFTFHISFSFHFNLCFSFLSKLFLRKTSLTNFWPSPLPAWDSYWSSHRVTAN